MLCLNCNTGRLISTAFCGGHLLQRENDKWLGYLVDLVSGFILKIDLEWNLKKKKSLFIAE